MQSPAGASDPNEPRARLGSYGILTGAYAAALGAFLWRFHDRLPETISAGDLALIGVASHKTARAIAKDKVMAPYRAPCPPRCRDYRRELSPRAPTAPCSARSTAERPG